MRKKIVPIKTFWNGMNINEEKLVPIKTLRNKMNMDEEKTFTKQYRMNMGEEKSSTKQKYYKHRIEEKFDFLYPS